LKAKTIKQEVSFRAEAQKVYDALMDSKKHSQFTGSECVISKKAGGKFTAYGGYIKGVNLELVPGKKIVQSWRASDWPEGHYSKAIFILERKDSSITPTDSSVPAILTVTKDSSGIVPIFVI